MTFRASPILIAAAIAASPLLAQQTIEIPREQIEALPDLPVPRIDPDLSSIEGMVRSIEDIVRIDWTDTLPEAITEMILGASPIEAHASVVWEMQVSGSWNETVAGQGTLNVMDQTALGAAQGRQFYAVLDTDARGWPFHLFSFVPDTAPAVARTGFSGTGDGHPGGGTGFSHLSNHMFEYDRVLGYATPDGMGAQSFSDVSDADFSGEYLYTEVQGGRIRVDSSANAYRVIFSATVQEFTSDGREPTGRSASLRGWVCEARAYEQDPDSCLYDDFQIVDHTPPAMRGNVNPAHPAVSVTFSDQVDLASLADGFSLMTRDADGAAIEVAGTWRQSPHVGAWRDAAAERAAQIQPRFSPATCSDGNVLGLASHNLPVLDTFADPQEYVFYPDTPLRPGTQYEARVAGGESGVRARHSDEYLGEDHVWRFSTLLQMDAQRPSSYDDPLRMHVFQTVRDPALVADKPAMTRVYPDWRAHEDIAPDWQPDRFAFEMVLSQHHPRVVSQRGQRARLNRMTLLEPQDAFDDEDRRHARHSVNFFGWLPQRDMPDVLEIVACPDDPFPHPMPQAETRQKHLIEIWDHDPGNLDFYYVVAEVGPWATLLEQLVAELVAIRREVLRDASLKTAEALFSMGGDLLRGDLAVQDLAGEGARDLLDTLEQIVSSEDSAAQLAEMVAERLQPIIDRLASIESGISEADQRAITQTLALTEEYTPQFLPYHSARARPTGFTFGNFNLFLGQFIDPLTGVAGVSSDVAYGVTKIPGIELMSDQISTEIRYGAYVRWLQRMALDYIGPEDFLVVLVPDGELKEGTAGLALSPLESSLYKGLLDYRTRALIMAIQDDAVLTPDVLATGLVHEFGHVLMLQHFPGEDPIPSLRRDPAIDGFRLHTSGLHGWNKSFREGNAEDPEILRSLMWPTLQPSRSAWLTEWEYWQAQREIQRGFGQRDAALWNRQIRLAQAAPDTRSDARIPPVDQIILSGVVNPLTTEVMIDPLRVRSAALTEGSGPYRAELLDAQGRVLHSAAFNVRNAELNPMIAHLRGEAQSSNIMHWPDFRVAVPAHPQATTLVVWRDQTELARISAGAGAPVLQFPSVDTLEIGPEPTTFGWSVDMSANPDARVVFDVEYSPDGGASWSPVSLFQRQPAVVLDATMLDPGHNPMLRIKAVAGLHADTRVLPVRLIRPLQVSEVILPDPHDALAGVPATLRFDAPLESGALDTKFALHDDAGQHVALEVLHLPAQHSVSLLPRDPLQADQTYSVTLSPDLHDVHGNALGGAERWTFTTTRAR